MPNLKIMLLGLAVASTARAMPVAFDLTGTIDQIGTQGQSSLVVGQHIPIVITLDSSSQANVFYNSPSPPDAYPIISATFNGVERSFTFNQIVTIMPDYSIEMSSATPLIGAGFNFLMAGAIPGILHMNTIPSSLNPNDFSVGTFSVTQVFSPQFEGFSGTIDGVSVPEPASLAMLVAALFGLCAVRRRKVHCSEAQ